MAKHISRWLSAIISILALVILLVFLDFSYRWTSDQASLPTIHDGTYIIGDTVVALENGHAETGSVITDYFGDDLSFDLDGDGRLDRLFIVTQQTGGSGTFYYLTGLLADKTGLNGVVLGDRAKPQNIAIDHGVIVVNYLDRELSDSFTVAPDVLKTKYIKYEIASQSLLEIKDNTVRSLTAGSWIWSRTIYSNGQEIMPKNPVFSLSFAEGRLSVKTDCNSLGGSYQAQGNLLTISDLMSTLMYCDGSQESDFSQMLSEVKSYHFNESGQLILDFAGGQGSVFFTVQ